MPIGTELKKLKKKLEKQGKNEPEHILLPSEKLKIKINSEKDRKKAKRKKLESDLTLLKKLDIIIKKGATGFELAYEIEKSQSIKRLIHDGVLFYNSFLEIGLERFLDIPDEKRVDFKNFSTIEKTEKYLFLIWLKESIKNFEKRVDLSRKRLKPVETRKILITHCKNCKAKIKDPNQKFCEFCGIKIN